jgi:hypothetical protein
MGIEEGEEVQTKGMNNIFNKIITENFPNLEKSREGVECVVREGVGVWGRNDPSLVCTYE